MIPMEFWVYLIGFGGMIAIVIETRDAIIGKDEGKDWLTSATGSLLTGMMFALFWPIVAVAMLGATLFGVEDKLPSDDEAE